MAFGYEPRRSRIDFGLQGPFPPDILILMGVTFATYTLGAFATTSGLVGILQLTNRLWTEGFLWQLATYPFASYYGSPLGLLLSLWMMLMFGKQVFYFVGRKAFWRYFFTAALAGAMVAVALQILLQWTGLAGMVLPFALLNGQTMIVSFLIAGFAALYGDATILLFFVLPVKAAWFVGIEIGFAFLAFLAYHDFAGFVGLCVVIMVAYFSFSGRGLRRVLHELRLRFERRRIERELRKLRQQGGGQGDLVKGPWVN